VLRASMLHPVQSPSCGCYSCIVDVMRRTINPSNTTAQDGGASLIEVFMVILVVLCFRLVAIEEPILCRYVAHRLVLRMSLPLLLFAGALL
jgi:hypothetical protein